MRAPSSLVALAKTSEETSDGAKQEAPVRVLVVDDDPDVRHMLAEYLEREGMVVWVASCGREMLRVLEASTFSLIILDLRLGDEDGLDLLRRIRARMDTPVIIVTGHRRERHERALGLELGADDYVVKPFALRDLLARIHIVLRRRSTDEGGHHRSLHVSSFEGWRLDRDTRRLSDPGGHNVPLTKAEYTTLVALLDRAGRIVTREAFLAETALQKDHVDGSLEVQILRLRRKLETDPTAPRFIKTERGQGYVFAIPVDTSR